MGPFFFLEKYLASHPFIAFRAVIFFVSETAISAKLSVHAAAAYPFIAFHAILFFIAEAAVAAEVSLLTAAGHPFVALHAVVFFVSEAAVVAQLRFHARARLSGSKSFSSGLARVKCESRNAKHA